MLRWYLLLRKLLILLWCVQPACPFPIPRHLVWLCTGFCHFCITCFRTHCRYTYSYVLLCTGCNKDYLNRAYLLYDGVHYDPLVFKQSDGRLKYRFSADDDQYTLLALNLAKEAHKVHIYVHDRCFMTGAHVVASCTVICYIVYICTYIQNILLKVPLVVWHLWVWTVFDNVYGIDCSWYM